MAAPGADKVGKAAKNVDLGEGLAGIICGELG